MKTFEERYTAWIDGQLENGAFAAFEEELACRADVSEVKADKADAVRLRALLQEHLHAPALTNPDFFNHQLLERIDAESPRPARVHGAGQRAKPPLFAWGFVRLVGLGAFSLFAAAALYYGLMPNRSDSGAGFSVARRASVTTPGGKDTGSVIADDTTPSVEETHGRPGSSELVLAVRSPTPSPIEQTQDIQTFVPDQPANPTTATPLHYNKPNVNVLWLNGLEYSPTVPDADAATATTPAPTASGGP